LSHEISFSQGRRLSQLSNATWAAPLCEVRFHPAGVEEHITCRGIASETGRSCGRPRAPIGLVVRVGKARSRSR
jgi:hypothetical protein